MTSSPANCPHRHVIATGFNRDALRVTFTCSGCGRFVKPAGYVAVDQPLPDELALMDFAARLPQPRRTGQ